MTKVLIEKYVDGIVVEQIQLPAKPLLFLAGLLPMRAHQELWGKGLDVTSLLNRTTPTHWLEAKEGNVTKRVRVSLIE